MRLGLKKILLVIIVNHTGESDIVSISIFPRVFLLLVLKSPSDRTDLLVEMCILLSLVVFRPCGRGAKVKIIIIINHLR